MPNPKETARLVVGGVWFEDWDTVWVHHRWQDGWPLFRFTCAERSPLPSIFTSLQFKPGDRCTIMLGGVLAITGIITRRQTDFEAGSHKVTISGVGEQWAQSTSSINSDTGNFDKMDMEAIAKKVIGDVKGKLKVIGQVDKTPFDRAQPHPGDMVFDFLDRLARLRGATLGSDHEGNILLIGKHTGAMQQQLVEGFNILKMTCVYSNEQLSSLYRIKGQAAVQDGVPMRKTNEMSAEVKGGLKTAFKYFESVIEQPVKTMAELHMRASYEALQREGTMVTANVTVQGWLRDGVTLWRPGDNVFVSSPMAVLDMVMKIKSAIFQQDTRSGTTTILELVLPWMLGDEMYKQAVSASIPQEPPKATTISDAASNFFNV